MVQRFNHRDEFTFNLNSLFLRPTLLLYGIYLKKLTKATRIFNFPPFFPEPEAK